MVEIINALVDARSQLEGQARTPWDKIRAKDGHELRFYSDLIAFGSVSLETMGELSRSAGVDIARSKLGGLKDDLERQVEGDKLDLAAAPVGLEPFGQLLFALTGDHSFALGSPDLQYREDSGLLVVTGIVPFGRIGPVETCATFAATPEDRFVFWLQLRLPEMSGWNPFERSSFEICKIVVNLVSTPWGAIYGDLRGKIRLTRGEMPLRLQLPRANESWRFIGGEEFLRERVPGGSASTASSGSGDEAVVTVKDLANLIGAQDLARSLPPMLDQIGLAGFSFTLRGADLQSASAIVSSRKPWKLVDGIFEADRFWSSAYVQDPLKETRTFHLLVGSTVELVNTPVTLLAQRDWAPRSGKDPEGWSFQALISEIKLSDLVEQLKLGTQLPGELPADLTFENISLDVKPATNEFTFRGSARGSWDFPRGSGGIGLSRASFTLSRRIADGKPTYPFSIQLEAESQSPAKTWPEGIKVKSLLLEFSHEATKWTAGGELVIDLFEGKDIKLTAGYTHDEQKSVLTLGKKGADLDLLQFAKLNAGLRIQDISLSFTRTRINDGRDSEVSFEFAASARLTVADKLDATGTLRVGKAGGIELSFDAPGNPPAIRIPAGLIASADSPSIAFTNATIGIKPPVSSDGAKSSWHLEGGVNVRFRSFPPRIQQVLPDEDVTATLSIDKHSLSVSVSEVLSDREIPLPEIPMSHVQLKPLKANARNLTVSIDLDGDVTFSFDPVLTLPEGLNAAVFGRTGKDGTGPEREVLVTGEELRSELRIGLIDKAPGVEFSLRDSPLKAFPFDESGKNLPLDLGAAGLIKIELPRFIFGSRGFVASGGFSEDPNRPLALPLTLVKNLLAKKFPGLADAIPDAIPLLKRPDLLKGDGLDVEKLEKFLREMFGDQLPEGEASSALFDALQHLADGVMGLPKRLREYLFGDLPSDFHFSITADPTGSVIVDIRTHTPTADGTRRPSGQELDPTQGGRPIMVLFPALPQLVGLRLSNLQLGPIFGGSLILLRVNAEIDIFDPVMLAASIAAAEVPALKTWMPDSTDAHTTYQVHDLVMFIVYEVAEIPIPVPIFYEKLGFDVARPGGLELAASVSFNPLTHNGLAEVFETLSGLYAFVTTDARLDPKQGIQLDASIGPTYLKLPKFLGAGELGSEDEPLLDVNFSEIFANFLNGLKFFRLSDVLAGIPLEKRCGAASPEFGPIKLQGAWAATTRDEFSKGLSWSRPKVSTTNALVGLSEAERTHVLAVLDAAPKTGAEEGVVLLVAGEGKLGSLLSVGGRFGMVTAGHNGFATGVQVYGDLLAKTLDFKLSGLVHFDLTKPLGHGTAGFAGSACLLVNGVPTADASVAFSDEEIGFSVDVDLFPGLDAIAIAGRTAVSITAAGLNASGRARFKLFGLVSAEEMFQLTPAGFSLTATAMLLREVTLTVTLTAVRLGPEHHGAIALQGELRNFSPGVMLDAAKHARDQINGAIKNQIRWAEAEYKRTEARRWFLGKNARLAELDAYWAIYKVLDKGSDGTIATAISGFFDAAINLLPTGIGRAVRYLRTHNVTNPLESLNIGIEGRMDTALLGRVTLNVSGTFAGQPFAAAPFQANLAAPDYFSAIGRAISQKVL